MWQHSQQAESRSSKVSSHRPAATAQRCRVKGSRQQHGNVSPSTLPFSNPHAARSAPTTHCACMKILGAAVPRVEKCCCRPSAHIQGHAWPEACCTLLPPPSVHVVVLCCRAATNNDMAGEGVVGLKELGAREMSYRLMFVACSTKVRALGRPPAGSIQHSIVRPHRSTPQAGPLQLVDSWRGAGASSVLCGVIPCLPAELQKPAMRVTAGCPHASCEPAILSAVVAAVLQ